MDFSCKTRAISTFAKDVAKGRYNMKHKLQRQEGQWSTLQRGELIESLLRSYPIDPIRCEVKEDGINYVFDGVQRSTNICGYLTDSFKLPRSLKPVVIDGTEYEIAGKKFSQLDEAVQDKLKHSEIQVYLFTGCTDEDIREMFRRQNNGSPLRPSQKMTAYQSSELNEIIFTLASHEFFKKVLSSNQIKRDIHKDIIRETLMLSEVSKEHDITSFRTKDMNAFVIEYGENINTEKVNLISQALNKLNESFQDEIKIPKTSLSFVIYAMMRTIKDKKSTQKLVDTINTFVSEYDSNEEYKQYCVQGTSGNANVRGRLDYWRKIIREL